MLGSIFRFWILPHWSEANAKLIQIHRIPACSQLAVQRLLLYPLFRKRLTWAQTFIPSFKISKHSLDWKRSLLGILNDVIFILWSHLGHSHFNINSFMQNICYKCLFLFRLYSLIQVTSVTSPLLGTLTGSKDTPEDSRPHVLGTFFPILFPFHFLVLFNINE